VLSLESALYVSVQDGAEERGSCPWKRAFRYDHAYRVLDLLRSDMGSPAYALLSSGHQRRYVPVWALRVVACAPQHAGYELPLDKLPEPIVNMVQPLEEGHWWTALSQPQALRTGNVEWEESYHDVVESEQYIAPWLCKI
jgi:hypothetical protein